MQYVTKVTVKGQEFGVYIEAGGRFYCNVGVPYNSSHDHMPDLGDDDPNVIEAKSLQELQKKAKVRLETVHVVAIDVWKWDSGDFGKDERIIHGVLIGQHANRNLLIRWDESGRGRRKAGQVEQHGNWRAGLLKLDTKEKQEMLRVLQKAKRLAEKELEAFITRHSLDGSKEVARALGIGGKHA